MKYINSDIIIGNAIIKLKNKENCISIEKVYRFWSIVDKELKNKYCIIGSDNTVSTFCDDYLFLLKEDGDNIKLNEEENIDYKLDKYFNFGIPNDLKKIFNRAINTIIEQDEKLENMSIKRKGKVLCKKK